MLAICLSIALLLPLIAWLLLRQKCQKHRQSHLLLLANRMAPSNFGAKFKFSSALFAKFFHPQKQPPKSKLLSAIETAHRRTIRRHSTAQQLQLAIISRRPFGATVWPQINEWLRKVRT